MTKWEVIKGILTGREPGCGYFGGAEGAVRMVIVIVLSLVTLLAISI